MLTSHNVLLASPRQPTVLGDGTYYLSDSDLMLQFPVETAFLVEGELDPQRLVKALEETLAYFPIFCGQLTEDKHRWGILLVNRPIELEIVETHDLSLLPEDAVLQDTWLYSPTLDMSAIMACKDVPLLRMRLTRFHSDPPMTVLGASSAHLAGDGAFMVQFWRLLSQIYQGSPPLDPYPVYSRAIVDEIHLQTEDKAKFYDMFPQLSTRNPKPPPTTSRTTLFFSLAQLYRLQAALSQSPEAATHKLSLQDCVTAIVSVACSKANLDNQPINRIVNVLNLRGGLLPVEEPLNALSWVNATTSDPYDVQKTASSVRQAFIKAREPAFQSACLLAVRHLYRKVAIEGERVDFTPPPGNLFLNSSWKFQYTSAHFGFGEDKTHFLHTVFKAPRYAKMFRRNPPMPLDRNGRRTKKHRTESIEFTFYLLPSDRDDFLTCLQNQWMALGMQEPVEIMNNT